MHGLKSCRAACASLGRLGDLARRARRRAAPHARRSTAARSQAAGGRDAAGASVDSIDFWAARVRALEQRVEAARQAALKTHPSPSFFAFFKCARRAWNIWYRVTYPDPSLTLRAAHAPQGPAQARRAQ